ncbi:MAG: ComEC/Rec2 family competence protein [Planctomycetaceae bacterium]|nr:ComEC/Rec2 family competence protein [Planctomycetaceae bacterium]
MPGPRAVRHYQPLVILPTAAAFGIVCDRWTPLPLGVWLGSACAAWALWLVAFRAQFDRAAAVCLCAAAAALFGAWHHARWSLFSVDDLSAFAMERSTPVAFEAIVREAPRVIEPIVDDGDAAAPRPPAGYSTEDRPRTRFEIAALGIRDDRRWLEAEGVADVQIDGRLSDVEAGDRIRLFGRLSRSEPPLNPGEFDFAEHFRAERKLCVVRVANPSGVTVLEKRSPWNVAAWLSQARYSAQRRLLANVSSDQVGFASALLLGYRDLLARRDNWSFFRTGTVHILSISGLHIGMLAIFLHSSMRFGWLRRRTVIGVTVLVTAAYALLIDAEPPAVRAVIVVLLAACGVLSGRRALGFNMLGAAALIVLAMNPTDLFRVGPQLSFLAAAVLVWRSELRRGREPSADDVAAKLGRSPAYLWWRRRLRLFGSGLYVSALIFLVTTPLVAHRFHIVSPASLWLTPLLAIPVALALLFGFLTFTLGWLVPPLGAVCGAICTAMLAAVDYCVVRTQFWPGAAFWLPGPSLRATLAFYFFVGVWMMIGRTSVFGRRLVGGLLCLGCACSLVPRQQFPADTTMRTTFTAVGHGLSVLVEPSDAEPWLYDCGRMHAPEGAARSIAAVLWSRGITRLEAIVVSHGDADHYNALPYAVEQFRPRKIIVSRPFATKQDAAYHYVRALADHARIPLIEVAGGDKLPVAGSKVTATVLHPPQGGVSGANDNAESLVVALEAGGRRVLLTGDVEGRGLEELLAQPPLPCDVVLAPHHGSGNSNPPGLARWARPKYVVVSGAEGDSLVVREAYEASGAEVFETSVAGAVTAVIVGDRNRIILETFR